MVCLAYIALVHWFSEKKLLLVMGRAYKLWKAKPGRAQA